MTIIASESKLEKFDTSNFKHGFAEPGDAGTCERGMAMHDYEFAVHSRIYSVPQNMSVEFLLPAVRAWDTEYVLQCYADYRGIIPETFLNVFYVNLQTPVLPIKGEICARILTPLLNKTILVGREDNPRVSKANPNKPTLALRRSVNVSAAQLNILYDPQSKCIKFQDVSTFGTRFIVSPYMG